MTEELRRAFFEDLAGVEQVAADSVREAMTSEHLPSWVESTAALSLLREALTRPEQVEALAAMVVERVHVALHSVLVSIDGGSASAEVGSLGLVDASGRSIGDALHEEYVGYLFDTGRMS